jgi:hypothetical protein
LKYTKIRAYRVATLKRLKALEPFLPKAKSKKSNKKITTSNAAPAEVGK